MRGAAHGDRIALPDNRPAWPFAKIADHNAADLLPAAVVRPVGPGDEDALYEIESIRSFAGQEQPNDAMPDKTTILKFHHLLE